MHLDAFDTKIFYVNTWEMYYKIISLISLYADLEIYKSHRVVKLFLESNICLKLFLWWMKKYFIAYFILYIYIYTDIYIYFTLLYLYFYVDTFDTKLPILNKYFIVWYFYFLYNFIYC